MTSRRLLFLCAAIVAPSVASAMAPRPADGKIHLTYWEKWSGAEEYAMQQVVDQFNRSQDRIVVDFLSVGDIERKTLLATAGGDPPDVAGVYLSNVCQFADRNALTPLDNFIRKDGFTDEQFLDRYAPAFAHMGYYRDQVFAVPSTPTTVAMYWNKDLFREAGLDPDRPPRTLAELDAMSDKLLKRDDDGNLIHVGFLPQAGWAWSFPAWFGGRLFNGKNITIGTDPANLAAFDWTTSYSRKDGVNAIGRLMSTFGSLASAQDPFMNNQVAIIFDGVWRSYYIKMYAPGMNYGVAPWPSAQQGVDDFTVADSDMLIIPRGAKHPREAWEFLRFVSSPNLKAQRYDEMSGVELLCFLQEKASPMRERSPYFAANNPDRDVAVFERLAESRHIYIEPQIGIWDEYLRELGTAFDKSRLELQPPRQALQECQARMESSWQWHCQSLALRHPLATTSVPHSP